MADKVEEKITLAGLKAREAKIKAKIEEQGYVTTTESNALFKLREDIAAYPAPEKETKEKG